MFVTVAAKNGNPSHNFPDTIIKDVNIEVTKQEIWDQQETSPFGMAKAACRIKILNEATGEYSWFVITPTIKNGKPGLIVTSVSQSPEVSRTNPGKWRKPMDRITSPDSVSLGPSNFTVNNKTSV